MLDNRKWETILIQKGFQSKPWNLQTLWHIIKTYSPEIVPDYLHKSSERYELKNFITNHMHNGKINKVSEHYCKELTFLEDSRKQVPYIKPSILATWKFVGSIMGAPEFLKRDKKVNGAFECCITTILVLKMIGWFWLQLPKKVAEVSVWFRKS